MRIIFGEGPENVYTLADILPHRFGPQDLLEDDSQPLLLQEQCHSLDFNSGNFNLVPPLPLLPPSPPISDPSSAPHSQLSTVRRCFPDGALPVCNGSWRTRNTSTSLACLGSQTTLTPLHRGKDDGAYCRHLILLMYSLLGYDSCTILQLRCKS